MWDVLANREWGAVAPSRGQGCHRVVRARSRDKLVYYEWDNTPDSQYYTDQDIWNAAAGIEAVAASYERSVPS